MSNRENVPPNMADPTSMKHAVTTLKVGLIHNNMCFLVNISATPFKFKIRLDRNIIYLKPNNTDICVPISSKWICVIKYSRKMRSCSRYIV